MNRAGTARAAHASFNFFPAFSGIPGVRDAMMQVRWNFMNIQEENSALYFRVQSEREQTLVSLSAVKPYYFFQLAISSSVLFRPACNFENNRTLPLYEFYTVY